MAFILYTAASTTGSRLRSVSVRTLAMGGATVALALLGAGAGLGYWLSPLASLALAAVPSVPAAVAAAPGGPERARAALPFAVEQIGALSGRLFKLESQASQLSERLGRLQGIAAPAKAAAPAPRPVPNGGSGGPMLAPHAESGALEGEVGVLQQRIGEVEQLIAQLADAATERSVQLMRTPTRLPLVHAAVVSLFGNRDDPMTGRRAFHSGLDFAAVTGTVIHAAAGGLVKSAGFHHDYGWMVEIDHGNGLVTRYAHASRLMVRPGEVVAPGAAIAAVGSTGRSTGPHLHFEVLRNGEATDPRRYLAGV